MPAMELHHKSINQETGHHADHGVGGAALRAEGLAEADLPHREGHGQQDVGGVLDGIGPDVLGGAQQHHKRAAENEGDQAEGADEAHGREGGGGRHPGGLFVPLGAQQPGDVAGRAHAEADAHGPDKMHQGVVDAHSRRGRGAQGADEIGVSQVVE